MAQPRAGGMPPEELLLELSPEGEVEVSQRSARIPRRAESVGFVWRYRRGCLLRIGSCGFWRL